MSADNDPVAQHRQKDIDDFLERLDTHREHLANLLNQQALFGKGYIPSHITSDINDQRNEIAHIKAILRGWQVQVEDHPNDENKRSNASAKKAAPSKKSKKGDARKLKIVVEDDGVKATNRPRVQQGAKQRRKQTPSTKAAWYTDIRAKLGEALITLEEKLTVQPYLWATLDVEKPADEDIHIVTFFAGHMRATNISTGKIREIEEEIQARKYVRNTISQNILQQVAKIRERNVDLDAALTITSGYSNSISISYAIRNVQSYIKDLIDIMLSEFNEADILLKLSFIAVSLEILGAELKNISDELTNTISHSLGRPIDIQLKITSTEPPGKERLS